MSKIMYYCESCGEMYADEDIGLSTLRYDCKKCKGILRKTGNTKKHNIFFSSKKNQNIVPPLTKDKYDEFIKNGEWDKKTIYTYCPSYPNKPLSADEACQTNKDRYEKLRPNSINNQPNPQYSQFTPKCPTCGCTEIRKISATEKAVNIGMFGLLGNKRKYQFECMNPACKYKW